MGQFKPMVKMQTTEPSVILKLKKGGSVQRKFADGGPVLPPQAAPQARAALANPAIMRQAALARRRPMVAPAGGRAMPAVPAAPLGRGMPVAPAVPAVAPRPAMKKGGKFGGKETPAEEKAEASVAKCGGGKMKKATGGVVLGQAGFKSGGATKKAFAAGGEVATGRPVAMPTRRVSNPVAVDRLAGAFKKGGRAG